MILRNTFVIFLVFALFIGVCASAQAVDLYWVVFCGDSAVDSVYVMQINQSGTVTKAPVAVLAPAQFGSVIGAAALGKGTNGNLNLWKIGTALSVFRAILNPSTLTVTSISNLGLKVTDEDILQSTNKASGNFLEVEVSNSVLKGYATRAGGTLTGTSWTLTPSAPNLNDEASLSEDGLLATAVRFTGPSATTNQLYVQLLDSAGKPSGSPKQIASFADLEASDVTSLLSTNQRFVAYMVTAGTTPANKLLLQPIDIAGNKVGSAKTINSSPLRDEQEQIVAIDPLGRFVLFTIEGSSFGCSGRDILVYQALTSTGAITGGLKVIAGCTFIKDDILDINILKN